MYPPGESIWSSDYHYSSSHFDVECDVDPGCFLYGYISWQ